MLLVSEHQIAELSWLKNFHVTARHVVDNLSINSLRTCHFNNLPLVVRCNMSYTSKLRYHGLWSWTTIFQTGISWYATFKSLNRLQCCSAWYPGISWYLSMCLQRVKNWHGYINVKRKNNGFILKCAVFQFKLWCIFPLVYRMSIW